MTDSREDHSRGFYEDDEGRISMHNLIWDVNMKEKQKLINKQFPVGVPNMKWGNIVWAFVKNIIIEDGQISQSIALLLQLC